MDRLWTRGVGVFCVALAVSAGGAWYGVDPSPQNKPAQDRAAQEKVGRIANVTKQFEELRTTFGAFNGAFDETLVASVKLEKLLEAKSGKKNTWGCEDALTKAAKKSKDLRSDLGANATKIKRLWKASKDTSAGLSTDELPWKSDGKTIDEKVTAVASLFNDVDSSKTAQGEKTLAALWKKVQTYADGMPSTLPAAKATDMMPAQVTVECINKKVTLR